MCNVTVFSGRNVSSADRIWEPENRLKRLAQFMVDLNRELATEMWQQPAPGNLV